MVSRMYGILEEKEMNGFLGALEADTANSGPQLLRLYYILIGMGRSAVGLS